MPPALDPALRQRVYPSRGVHGRIVEAVGQRILGGALAPGDLLPPESELAGQMGSSRTAVREAIKVLAAKGLITTRQKRGSEVRPTREWNLLDPDVLAWLAATGAGPELTAQMIELRRMVEPGAARLAALRHDEAALDEIDAALAGMRDAVPDPIAYYRADLAFHRGIFAATGNRFLDRLGALVGTVLETSFGLQRRSAVDYAGGLALHEVVRTKIAARDGEGAARAMEAVIEAARDELIAAGLLDRRA